MGGRQSRRQLIVRQSLPQLRLNVVATLETDHSSFAIDPPPFSSAGGPHVGGGCRVENMQVEGTTAVKVHCTFLYTVPCYQFLLSRKCLQQAAKLETNRLGVGNDQWVEFLIVPS